MFIGELARRSGVTVETIRFYESKGLMPPVLRLPNNYRDYGQEHLARLHFIRHCRALDITLEDIERLVLIDSQGAEHFADVHTLIDEKLEAVQARIHELEHLRDKLVQLKNLCSGAHETRGEPCGILQGLQSYNRHDHDCCEQFVDTDDEGEIAPGAKRFGQK